MNYKSLLLFFFVTKSYEGLRVSSNNFCKNCRFYIQNFKDPQYSKCYRFPKIYDDYNYLVTGKESDENTEFYYCSTARMSDILCGEKGNKYEKKLKN
jgi:hypothetical protein